MVDGGAVGHAIDTSMAWGGFFATKIHYTYKKEMYSIE
jgi:hypothetical protein